MHVTAIGNPLTTDICAVWFYLAIAIPTLLPVERSRRTGTRMADLIEILRWLAVNIKPISLLAIGPVASWKVYDLSLLPTDTRAIISRVLKCTRLTKILTRMMASVFGFMKIQCSNSSFVLEVKILAIRLTWILIHFYGAISHHLSWILGQSHANSVAQRNGLDWIIFLHSFR